MPSDNIFYHLPNADIRSHVFAKFQFPQSEFCFICTYYRMKKFLFIFQLTAIKLIMGIQCRQKTLKVSLKGFSKLDKALCPPLPVNPWVLIVYLHQRSGALCISFIHYQKPLLAK